jgi:hypothetical protein
MIIGRTIRPMDVDIAGSAPPVEERIIEESGVSAAIMGIRQLASPGWSIAGGADARLEATGVLQLFTRRSR